MAQTTTLEKVRPVSERVCVCVQRVEARIAFTAIALAINYYYYITLALEPRPCTIATLHRIAITAAAVAFAHNIYRLALSFSQTSPLCVLSASTMFLFIRIRRTVGRFASIVYNLHNT